jgi:hypothetical protein
MFSYIDENHEDAFKDMKEKANPNNLSYGMEGDFVECPKCKNLGANIKYCYPDFTANEQEIKERFKTL